MGAASERQRFDATPVALFDEDYSAVETELNRLRQGGVDDIGSYLRDHPDEVTRLIQLIRVRAVNATAVQMLGVESEADLLGPFRAELIDDYTRLPFGQQFETIWDGGTRISSEILGQQYDGRHIDCILNWAAPVTDEGPDYSRVQVALLDISARTAAERIHRETASRLHHLYRLSEEVNATLDLDQVLDQVVGGGLQLLYADHLALYLFGPDGNEVTHRRERGAGTRPESPLDPPWACLAGRAGERRTGSAIADIDEMAEASPACRAWASRLGLRTAVYVPVRPDNETRGVVVAARFADSPPFDDQDLLFAEMLTAVASRAVMNARLYTELRRTLDELQAVQASLLQAHKLEAVGQLAAGVAHEINTPIQFVSDNLVFLRDTGADVFRLLGAADTLAAVAEAHPDTAEAARTFRTEADAADSEFLREEIPQAVEQSLEGVSRVAGIVRALKDFSHPGLDTPEPVDINTALTNTITISRGEWKEVAEVVTDLDPDAGTVEGLAGPLKQVFLNMVVNAAQAIESAQRGADGIGTITVSTARVDAGVEIRIADTGCGIPAAALDRIFDPFFTTKDVGVGSGQGLAIAHDVVVGKHRGRIEVESEPEAGTTFVLHLPDGPGAVGTPPSVERRQPAGGSRPSTS